MMKLSGNLRGENTTTKWLITVVGFLLSSVSSGHLMHRNDVCWGRNYMMQAFVNNKKDDMDIDSWFNCYD